jgi:hypothetical protein
LLPNGFALSGKRIPFLIDEPLKPRMPVPQLHVRLAGLTALFLPACIKSSSPTIHA